MRTREGQGPNALDEIRVLDVGLLVQGPVAGQMLSDLGADVVKVELPGVGDYSRWIPISSSDRRAPWFIACNRGKRSIALDLRTEGGRKLFLALAAKSDVVISNFVPGTMERWGLGYAELSGRNPAIVYAAASAFGSDTAAGMDLVGQALSGLISMTGPPESNGYPVGVTIADHIGGQNLTIGILSALLARTRTGVGQQVSTSLVGGLIFAQAPEMTAYFLSGEVQGPAGRGHGLLRTIYGVFKTLDGALVITHIPETVRQAFWSAVGAPEVATRIELNGALAPDARADLFHVLDAALSARTTESWCRIFDQLQVHSAPVRDYTDVGQDPRSYSMGYLQRVRHPRWGEVTMPGSPLQMSGTAVRPGEFAPGVGEHTVEILRDYLGLTDREINALREAGTITVEPREPSGGRDAHD